MAKLGRHGGRLNAALVLATSACAPSKSDRVPSPPSERYGSGRPAEGHGVAPPETPSGGEVRRDMEDDGTFGEGAPERSLTDERDGDGSADPTEVPLREPTTDAIEACIARYGRGADRPSGIRRSCSRGELPSGYCDSKQYLSEEAVLCITRLTDFPRGIGIRPWNPKLHVWQAEEEGAPRRVAWVVYATLVYSSEKGHSGVALEVDAVSGEVLGSTTWAPAPVIIDKRF